MKSQILATAIFLTTISLVTTAHAANFEHVRQLLATKECQNCDLSNAGLVMADLSGADLRGANLTNANLSRANLSGADLRGANLSRAGLFGVNLSQAKLTGANLIGADLRNTYLANTDFNDASLDGVNFQGAVGIPMQLATPEEFYALGVAEAQKGNQKQAINYFDQAIASQPEYAGAYLARGVARYQIFDRKGAFADAEIAEKMFTEQENEAGIQTAQAFMQELQTPYSSEVTTGKPKFFDFVGSLGSVLLQFLPF
ncbi:pentapeptide repeat-containing protein [Nodularia harveyana UHCC-0300]|uniref:Pentapeptide repeat-containing protein n=1 Tax=Nodularia harveyana UHCC-0300 TaxID=2974287 RepID=A0ABU5UE67_9CYAN|nr:pentapeptide repeat-containing protein [Nodularia harveyana]MEA5581830.1 pentapeptide repeat-containing protein [Nodularia harveyana UHCC-0300]